MRTFYTGEGSVGKGENKNKMVALQHFGSKVLLIYLLLFILSSKIFVCRSANKLHLLTGAESSIPHSLLTWIRSSALQTEAWEAERGQILIHDEYTRKMKQSRERQGSALSVLYVEWRPANCEIRSVWAHISLCLLLPSPISLFLTNDKIGLFCWASQLSVSSHWHQSVVDKSATTGPVKLCQCHRTS